MRACAAVGQTGGQTDAPQVGRPPPTSRDDGARADEGLDVVMREGGGSRALSLPLTCTRITSLLAARGLLAAGSLKDASAAELPAADRVINVTPPGNLVPPRASGVLNSCGVGVGWGGSSFKSPCEAIQQRVINPPTTEMISAEVKLGPSHMTGPQGPTEVNRAFGGPPHTLQVPNVAFHTLLLV